MPRSDSSGTRPGRALLRQNPATITGAALLLVLIVSAFFVPEMIGSDPITHDLLNVLAPPSAANVLGTDQFGRDVLARVLHGGRVTFGLAAITTILGSVLGLFLGIAGAYAGGWLEVVTMRVVDVLLALPGLLLALTVVAAMGFGTESVVVAVSLASTPAIARVAHATTLQVKQYDFILAARALGARELRIVARHLWPAITPSFVSIAVIRLSRNILLVSALSIVGVGIQPPTPEWGLMIASGMVYLSLQPTMVLVPAALIVAASLGFSLLGDGLTDGSNPRTEGAR